MRSIITWFKLAFTALGSMICYYIGGMDGLIYTLIALVTADYITGVMSAVIHKKLNSRVGYKGIFHKILIFCLVGVGNMLDVNIIKTGEILRTAVILYYIANEGISIIENACEIGLPVPKKLKDTLEQLKGGNGNDSDA